MQKQAYYTNFRIGKEGGGLLHSLTRFIKSVQEAAASGRVLILPFCFLFRNHNSNLLNNTRELYDYLLLDETEIHVNGKRRVFSYLRMSDLERRRVKGWTIRYLSPHDRLDGNDPARLLIRFETLQLAKAVGHINVPPAEKALLSDCADLLPRYADTPPFLYNRKGKTFIYNREGEHVRVRLFSQPQHRQLAEEVVNALGADHYALHVRRGDRRRQWRGYNEMTKPQAIIERIRGLVPQGATLYLMSDEPDEHFFDPLKRHWQLARHWDFPQLERLVNQPNPLLVDNNALFLTEGLIYCRAKTKIGTYREHGIAAFNSFFDSRNADESQYYLYTNKNSG